MSFLNKVNPAKLVDNVLSKIDDSTLTVGLYMDTISWRDEFVSQQGETVKASATSTQSDLSWTFWFGETLALAWFWVYFDESSLAFDLLCTVMSSLLSLWLRGRVWRYAILLGIEGVIALLLEFAFPLMEIILENVSRYIVSEIALEKIVRHRLKRVGEKIRMHDKKIKWMFKRKRIRRRLRRVLGKVLKNQKTP